jgi:hypothetical protein
MRTPNNDRVHVAKTFAAVFALAIFATAALGAQGASARSDAAIRRALLVRGADAVKGLPFFPPNAIAALSGAYALDGSTAPGGTAAPQATPDRPETAVWYSREAIVFGAAWKRVDLGAAASPGETAYSSARGAATVLALKTGKYALFFELLSGEDPRSRAFILAFDRKFLAFFTNAATDAELSFPAYVDY